MDKLDHQQEKPLPAAESYIHLNNKRGTAMADFELYYPQKNLVKQRRQWCDKYTLLHVITMVMAGLVYISIGVLAGYFIASKSKFCVRHEDNRFTYGKRLFAQRKDACHMNSFIGKLYLTCLIYHVIYSSYGATTVFTAYLNQLFLFFKSNSGQFSLYFVSYENSIIVSHISFTTVMLSCIMV